MQLKSEERLNFYRRLALSGSVFLLLFSLGANIFLLITRPPDTFPSYTNPVPLEDRLLLEPNAFGEVKHGFTVKTQDISGTSAVLPVSSYVVAENILPKLSALQYLYRDQGVELDAQHVQTLLKDMNIPLDWESIGLLPVQEKWRSADGTREFILDTEKRSLTVSVLGSFGPSSEGRADDATTMQIAKLFLKNLGIEMSNVHEPMTTEKIFENGSSRTYVVWPMTFDDLPLVNVQGQPVYGAQVQVGRLSRRALSATITLLSPESLPKSAYPSASEGVLRTGLETGGLSPAPKMTGKKVAVANLTEATQVYILYPKERHHPTYIVPGLQAVWMQSSCSTCSLVPITTVVPSLDPVTFEWYAGANTATGSGLNMKK